MVATTGTVEVVGDTEVVGVVLGAPDDGRGDGWTADGGVPLATAAAIGLGTGEGVVDAATGVGW